MIDGFQAPVFIRPAHPQGLVAIVDLFQQIRDRFPAEAGCDLGSNVQVDPRNKEISTRSDQSSDVAKASFRVRRTHMAEKPVGNYNVLRPQSIDHSWISSIAKAPIDALSDPRLDPEVVPLPVEHL